MVWETLVRGSEALIKLARNAYMKILWRSKKLDAETQFMVGILNFPLK